MYWEEKIDLVKQKFSAPDFKDPFREGNSIIEKVLVKLLETTWLNFHNSSNRETLLKNAQLRKSCTTKELYQQELASLDADTNYWLLLVHIPLASDFRIYDCKLAPLIELLYQSSGQPHQEFFIVDKKYRWLRFYKVDHMNDVVKVYEMRK